MLCHLPSRVIRGPFPLLQHLELLLAPQGVLGKAGSWEAAREAPLTLIGCLVTNCATRMGLRLKETQSWTEEGCELPSKRCAEHRDTLGGVPTPKNHPHLHWDLPVPGTSLHVGKVWQLRHAGSSDPHSGFKLPQPGLSKETNCPSWSVRWG